MADFKFNCQHCKQSLEAPDEMLGQQINCPSCGGALQLPSHTPPPLPPQTTQSSETPPAEAEPPQIVGNIKLAGSTYRLGLFVSGDEVFAALGPLVKMGNDIIVMIAVTLLACGLGILIAVVFSIRHSYIRKRFRTFEHRDLASLRRWGLAAVFPVGSISHVHFDRANRSLVLEHRDRFPFRQAPIGSPKRLEVIAHEDDVLAFERFGNYLKRHATA